MKKDILIPLKDNSYWCFSLNLIDRVPYIVDLPDICYFRFYKYHDHRYEFAYFVYNPRYLGFYEYRSKKELYCAVQKLLKRFL